jgi:hypothetical protein
LYTMGGTVQGTRMTEDNHGTRHRVGTRLAR